MLIIKSRKKRSLGLNEPLRHESHKKPVTRRDFLAQGFTTGAATVVAPAVLGALLGSRRAQAQTVDLSPDIDFQADPINNICNIEQGASKIPFICFDLAGGREHRRLERAGRQGRWPARLPVDAGLFEARPARHDAAEQRHAGLHQ
jgi:hypothetical protein